MIWNYPCDPDAKGGNTILEESGHISCGKLKNTKFVMAQERKRGAEKHYSDTHVKEHTVGCIPIPLNLSLMASMSQGVEENTDKFSSF